MTTPRRVAKLHLRRGGLHLRHHDLCLDPRTGFIGKDLIEVGLVDAAWSQRLELLLANACKICLIIQNEFGIYSMISTYTQIAVLIVAMLLAPVAGVSGAEQRKPNILFIFADDWGWGDLSCHGHPYVRTPNIDRSARGNRFSSIYGRQRCLFAQPHGCADRTFPLAIQH